MVTESCPEKESTGTDRARPRVAIVVSNPIQHFCPFYRAIAASGQVELRVVFLSPRGSVPFFDPQFGRTIQWQSDLLAGFDYRFLAKADPETRTDRRWALRQLAPVLRDFQPEILVNYGFYTPLARDAFAWAIFHRRKILYISDSPDQRRGNPWQRFRRRMLLSILFRSMDGYLAAGDSNRRFYRKFGVRDNAIFYCPFTVDEGPLREAARCRTAHRRALLDRYRMPDDSFVVLFVGKLGPHKRPADLLLGMRLILDRGVRHIHLMLAGDGPEEPALRSMAADMCSHVHFAGFVPVADLPGYLAGADLLAQPSEIDHHPLAISEALYCGLPILASEAVGSIGFEDDVQPGVNGFCFPVGDVRAIADSILRLAFDQDLHQRCANASLSISRLRSVQTSVAGFLAAVHHLTRN